MSGMGAGWADVVASWGVRTTQTIQGGFGASASGGPEVGFGLQGSLGTQER